MNVYTMKGKRINTDEGATFFYRRSGTQVDFRISEPGLELDDFCFLEKIIRELKSKLVSETLNGGAA